MSDSLEAIVRDFASVLRREAGRGGKIKVSPEMAARLAAWQPGMVRPSAALSEATTSPAPREGHAALGDTGVAGALRALAAEVAQCEKCSLCRTRTQTVFGVGNPNADLVFVGEAPGAEEDRRGEPFVGRAGQLLTDIIEKGMKLRRDDVYICNVLKCRPPENRDPNPEEVHYCEPYLVQQLQLIAPKVICALGKHAAQTLLRTDAPIGRLRGQWHSYQGIPLRVTYHPAYLLRNPADKVKTWEDIKEVMKALGLGGGTA
jgi:DNA polymerase